MILAEKNLQNFYDAGFTGRVATFTGRVEPLSSFHLSTSSSRLYAALACSLTPSTRIPMLVKQVNNSALLPAPLSTSLAKILLFSTLKLHVCKSLYSGKVQLKDRSSFSTLR